MTHLAPALLTLAIALTLGACQSTPGTAPLPERATQMNPPAAEPEPAPEPIVYGNFTPEQLNRALVNELAGQRGYLPEAVRDYYALALETRDLAVVRRASQFAAAAEDTDTMIALGRLWLEIEPDSEEAHLVMAFQLLEAGMLEESMEHMGSILAMGGELDFSVISGRTQYLLPEQRASLLAQFQKLHARFPEHETLHYAVMQLLEQSNEHAQALEELNQYKARHGDSARIRLMEAQLYLQLQQMERTLELLEDGIETYPDHRLIRFNYGRILVQTGDLESAREQFQELARMAPDDYESLYSLALLELELESLDAARSYLIRLQNAGVRTNETHYYLGFIDQNQGRRADAVDHYLQVEPAFSNYLNAQRQAVRLLVEDARYDEAHARVLSVSDGRPEVELMLLSVEVDALMNAGQLERADARLTESLQVYVDNIDLLFARSLVNDRRGDLGKVEEDLRRIIDLEPTNATALNQLGYTLADRTDRYTEALALLERAIAADPEDPAIIDSLAWAQYKLGRYDEALANLERAFAVFPDPEVAAHLGEVLWVMGRRSDANRVWNESLRENPESRILLDTIDRLRNGADS
jgi:tetratricopeptide (TPR) repeat protein